MVELINISDWIIREWDTPTKGTRKQKIVDNPKTNDTFYFKLSKVDYPSEFWSEIIASKFGQLIGFNVLDYNVGLLGSEIGCISKSMIDKEYSMLYHGVSILFDFATNFTINAKPTVSFQQITDICKLPYFEGFLEYFIKMIIFDSLIGNTDRHTENWAFIIHPKNDEVSNIIKNTQSSWISNLKESILGKSKTIGAVNSSSSKQEDKRYIFSPIYDNGSCLGRELTEEKLSKVLNSRTELNTYIRRGKHEIRWNNDKLRFFQLCSNIQSIHREVITRIVLDVVSKIESSNFDKIIDEIDKTVLGKVENTFINLERKELIKLLLKTRLNYLLEELKIG